MDTLNETLKKKEEIHKRIEAEAARRRNDNNDVTTRRPDDTFNTIAWMASTMDDSSGSTSSYDSGSSNDCSSSFDSGSSSSGCDF